METRKTPLPPLAIHDKNHVIVELIFRSRRVLNAHFDSQGIQDVKEQGKHGSRMAHVVLITTPYYLSKSSANESYRVYLRSCF